MQEPQSMLNMRAIEDYTITDTTTSTVCAVLSFHIPKYIGITIPGE